MLKCSVVKIEIEVELINGIIGANAMKAAHY